MSPDIRGIASALEALMQAFEDLKAAVAAQGAQIQALQAAVVTLGARIAETTVSPGEVVALVGAEQAHSASIAGVTQDLDRLAPTGTPAP